MVFGFFVCVVSEFEGFLNNLYYKYYMVSTKKTKKLNARGDAATSSVYYILIMVVVVVLVLYFVVIKHIDLANLFGQHEEFVFNKENIKQASAMCGTTLNNCCGNCHDFTTALVIAEEQKNQMCLDAVADTCKLLVLGCNATALKGGTFNMADEAKGKFTELCDQIYNDKIKCKYVAKSGCTGDGGCSGGGSFKTVTYKCIEGDSYYSEGNCVCVGGTSSITKKAKGDSCTKGAECTSNVCLSGKCT